MELLTRDGEAQRESRIRRRIQNSPVTRRRDTETARHTVEQTNRRTDSAHAPRHGLLRVVSVDGGTGRHIVCFGFETYRRRGRRYVVTSFFHPFHVGDGKFSLYAGGGGGGRIGTGRWGGRRSAASQVGCRGRRGEGRRGRRLSRAER